MSDTLSAVDGRREAGDRTRQRLIDATRALVADRGEDNVSLRAITEAAEANVAAVSYHFGSKDALVQAAIEQSVAQVLQQQVEGLRALAHPTLEQIAAAWVGPIVQAVAASPCPDQAFMRVAGRTLAACTGKRRVQLTAQTAAADEELARALERVLPEVDPAELRFRARAVGSIIGFVTTGHAELDGMPCAEIERLMLPVVAGALRGTTR